jgi:hypothetical protein
MELNMFKRSLLKWAALLGTTFALAALPSCALTNVLNSVLGGISGVLGGAAT